MNECLDWRKKRCVVNKIVFGFVNHMNLLLLLLFTSIKKKENNDRISQISFNVKPDQSRFQFLKWVEGKSILFASNFFWPIFSFRCGFFFCFVFLLLFHPIYRTIVQIAFIYSLFSPQNRIKHFNMYNQK